MNKNKIIIIFVLFFILIGSSNALFGSNPPPYHGGSTGGNVSGIISTSPYLYISSIAGIFNILLNETILNATIDDRALGGSFVPYTGATGDIDLNNKSITNINIINATTGYFSNHTVYIGDTKLSSNASNELSIGDGTGDVYGRFYYGSAKYLTDINLSSINGTVIFNGPLNMNGYNIFNVSNITAGNICYSNGTGCIANLSDYYTKTEINVIIANLNITGGGGLPGNGTVIEVVTCDGTCTTIIETEYY